jgi:alkanesulfonate monooxygenase SsuD/methylene tetrahydromethanopterin reductase-like flavin-dependent oxidoreductase (luciferase family)
MPNRADWRVIRDVYVAPTDREAKSFAINGMMGRCWHEFLLPLYLRLGLGRLLKQDSDMPDDAIDLAYLAEHLWIVGSPETVARRIQALQAGSGGFGRLLIVSYDAQNERAAWQRNLELLMRQVLPMCSQAGKVEAPQSYPYELRRARH